MEYATRRPRSFTETFTQNGWLLEKIGIPWGADAASPGRSGATGQLKLFKEKFDDVDPALEVSRSGRVTLHLTRCPAGALPMPLGRMLPIRPLPGWGWVRRTRPKGGRPRGRRLSGNSRGSGKVSSALSSTPATWRNATGTLPPSIPRWNRTRPNRTKIPRRPWRDLQRTVLWVGPGHLHGPVTWRLSSGLVGSGAAQTVVRRRQPGFRPRFPPGDQRRQNAA